MIIARSPLRVTLGGGGTDLPSYYRKHGGFLLAAAVDKYVYVALHRTFDQRLILKYSRTEEVSDVGQVEHPFIREALRSVGIENPHIEIVSLADIPAGTGLGSSGSFSTALLMVLHAWRGRTLAPRELAEQACAVEIDVLGRPVGKQDPYIAAYGGLRTLAFRPDGRVDAAPLALSAGTRAALEENLILFYTGAKREAASILRDQRDRTDDDDPEMLLNLHRVKDIAGRSRLALEAGNLEEFAVLLTEQWDIKKQRSEGMTNPAIDAWHARALSSGALGGKLVGAGGGGFLMFYAGDKTRLRSAMKSEGLAEVPFRFDDAGTKVIVS